MRIIKVLSFICFLTIGILAQTGATITGQLIVDGKVYPNTEVKLISQRPNSQEENYTTTTNNEGNYIFENVADGSYRLAYINSAKKLELLQDYFIGKGKDITAEVMRGVTKPSLLGEVSVIASGTQQVDGEISKTVNIIEAQELRDRADFSLTETLRTIPGFRVQQLGGFGRTASIKTRGLRNQDTAILIDGIRFRDASSITGDASAFLSDFSLTSVSKIEVLRGSGSSLYGTNAIGGTVDFQTPKPESGLHGNVSGAFGGLGLGRFRGNLSDGTKDGKFGFNLGVSRTAYTKGIDGDDNANNTNFQSRIEYNPFEKTNISARFFASDAFVRLNSSPDTIGNLPASSATIINAVPLSRDLLKRYENGETITNFGGANFIPDANDADNSQKSQFFSGQIALTQVINSKLVFQANYQGLRTKRTNTNGVLGIGFQPFSGDETSVFNGQIHTVNTHFNWTPNRQNLITAGYEFETERFGNDGLTSDGFGNFTTRASQSSNTVYVQDLVSFFNNRLQFAGGFRAQFFNLKTPTFSVNNPPYSNLTLENPPNAYTFDGAASYFFAKSATKIRAHVGNGYRVPSLYERFGTFFNSFAFPNRFEALGDPNLKPERTIAFDGGIEQNLFANRAKLSATYFYTRLIDIISFGNVVPNIGTTRRDFGGYISTKGGLSRGAEFSATISASDSTDIFASYTFTNSDQRTPQVSGSRILQTLGVPDHQFTLVATQRFKRAWVNFDFLATSDYLAPIFSNSTFQTYIYRFRGNRRGDLTAGYTFPLKGEKMNLRLFGTIENLFDYDYYENGFRTVGRNGRIGLSFAF